jgi:pyrimidine operon attenuation protein/uracil phosphoribosyltransferase
VDKFHGAEKGRHVLAGIGMAVQELTALASTLAGSKRTELTCYNKERNEILVQASTMPGPRKYSGELANPLLSARRPVVLFTPDEYQTVFKNHPFLTTAPQVRSLAAYYLITNEAGRWALCIDNPNPSFFSDGDALSSVERISSVLAAVLHSQHLMQQAISPKQLHPDMVGGMQEATIAPNSDVAFKFLGDTLISRPRLLGRHAVAYVALRVWRKPIKPYQIAALVAIKGNDVQTAAKAIAAEFVAHTSRLFGKTFDAIVPVPCGSSGRADCLSVEIANQLAMLLNADFENVLIAGKVPKSASHPAKSANLQPYKLSKPIKGRILLVDDVATSGRHLELARDALIDAGCDVNTMVWISD